jgi:predicted O-methyltransferase YrrM
VKRPTIEMMHEWAQIAHYPLREPELQWLEEINNANVLYYRWLYRLAAYMRPEVAMELGVCRAQGSAHIAAGVGLGGLTIGIDSNPWQPECANNTAAIREHGLRYEFLKADTTDHKTINAVRGFLGAQGKIGLLFIDTIHTYSQAIGEFYTYEPFLAKPAVIVMDDTLDPPNEVYRAFKAIPGERLEMNHLHIAGRGSVGFGAIIYG